MTRKMKDSGVEWIGMIPDGWNVVPAKLAFDEVQDVNKDGAVQKALKFKFGSIIPKTNFDSDDEYVAGTITNYTVVNDGDIIVNGLNLNYDLKSLRVGLVREKGVITSAYLALRPHTQQITSAFATYLLKGYETRMALHNMGYGIRKTLGFKEFKTQPILLPSLAEQNRIAGHLDAKCASIDGVIAKTNESIEEYKKLKQAVITEAVTKGVRGKRPMKDSGIDWIGQIPKEWRIGKIKVGTVKVGSGKTPSGGADVYSDEGVLFLRSQNVYDTGVTLDESATYITEDVDENMASTRVYPNDVLLNITGGSIGRCCVFPNELKRANVNQHVCIIRVKTDVFLAGYMQYYWISSLGKNAISLYQTGGNREGMTSEAIKNSSIPLITLEEQREIVDYLDSKCAAIDTLISKKQQFIDELTAYKKSLIYEYVTGKKEVPA